MIIIKNLCLLVKEKSVELLKFTTIITTNIDHNKTNYWVITEYCFRIELILYTSVYYTFALKDRERERERERERDNERYIYIMCHDH